MSRRIGRVGLALAIPMLLAVAVNAQSPSPLGTSPEPVGSDAASGALAPASFTPPPGDTAPLPARIMSG